MEETLSIQEIETRFPSEWVLIVDPVTNESLEVLRGKVAWHSKDRDEVYQKAIELRPQRAAYPTLAPFRKTRSSCSDDAVKSGLRADRRGGRSLGTKQLPIGAPGAGHRRDRLVIDAAILVSIGYDPALAPARTRMTTGSGVEFVPILPWMDQGAGSRAGSVSADLPYAPAQRRRGWRARPRLPAGPVPYGRFSRWPDYPCLKARRCIVQPASSPNASREISARTKNDPAAQTTSSGRASARARSTAARTGSITSTGVPSARARRQSPPRARRGHAAAAWRSRGRRPEPTPRPPGRTGACAARRGPA